MGRRAKIDMEVFKDMFYRQKLPSKTVREFFGVTESAIGAFRARNKLPPRGSYKVWNKKYPDEWQCTHCGISFKNKTGHFRRFCSQTCYNRHYTDRPTAFKQGALHWNYAKDRRSIIDRNKSGTVFSYKDKTRIAQTCDYRCNMCGVQFERLPIYRIAKTVRFDHIKPIRLGGVHSIENGQLLCIGCDKVKTHNDVIEILRVRIRTAV